jgi:hypothetical protein
MPGPEFPGGGGRGCRLRLQTLIPILYFLQKAGMAWTTLHIFCSLPDRKKNLTKSTKFMRGKNVYVCGNCTNNVCSKNVSQILVKGCSTTMMNKNVAIQI